MKKRIIPGMSAMKRARYFPPKCVRMRREYCPKCKHICVFPQDHELMTTGFSLLTGIPLDHFHMCAKEHQWR